MKYHFGAVAALIRDYRSETDLSQTDLSQALGYRNGQFISNVERALCSVPIRKLKLVCEVLKISHDDMERALLQDYTADIRSGLTFGDTDGNEILPIHSDTAGSREDTGQTLPA